MYINKRVGYREIWDLDKFYTELPSDRCLKIRERERETIIMSIRVYD